MRVDTIVAHADRYQNPSVPAHPSPFLPELSRNAKLTIAQVLCEKLKGAYIQDALDSLDPDATLGEAGEQFCWLHADVPEDGILAIVLALVLSLQEIASTNQS